MNGQSTSLQLIDPLAPPHDALDRYGGAGRHRRRRRTHNLKFSKLLAITTPW